METSHLRDNHVAGGASLLAWDPVQPGIRPSYPHDRLHQPRELLELLHPSSCMRSPGARLHCLRLLIPKAVSACALRTLKGTLPRPPGRVTGAAHRSAAPARGAHAE
ncbi:hypothetical protein NDU88_002613 [Pleurodeles waltl]|uniref:Uncharacterized protein n=1 Tax=Pleurodeles waltl TaxID=8319 RepID=A0AAV7TN39_PLEWA|nr:hypothetical protein NDU88_002613 [Pleurodeles waltl]